MPNINCDGCAKPVLPWHLGAKALKIGDEADIAISFDVLHAALMEEMKFRGVTNVAVAKKVPPIKCLCVPCWAAEVTARKWGDLGTYASARAKTTKDGIFFNVTQPGDGDALVARFDFSTNAGPGGSGPISAEGILSCLVHETIHYWSFNSLGLQEGGLVAAIGFDLDEYVTDMLGHLVFKRVFKGKFVNYVTPYADGSLMLTKIPLKFTENARMVKALADPTPAGDKLRANLPVALKEYFEAAENKKVLLPADLVRVKAELANNPKAPTPPKLYSQAGGLLTKVLFEHFVWWYFLGPNHPLPTAPGNKKASDFYNAAQDKGLRLVFVGNAQIFGGSISTDNKRHKI